MEIFDMHIHLGLTDKRSEEDILTRMENAGVYGGCVFSAKPKKDEEGNFDKRLSEVLEFCEGRRDRLFPIMWIHPYEDGIIEKIDRAVEAGIDGFKIICYDFYIYEETPMAVLRHIASKNKPVIFHSGILWDGGVSSEYNRPINFEALIKIKGLRFSMGHCSWPWHDECIAMYGKFLNGLTKGACAEMFFDITPGTPKIYREELFTKLYKIGYNVGSNVMFGCDCSGECYSTEWVARVLNMDREILDKLEIGKKWREKLYRDNLMRFLGKTDEKTSPESPVPDRPTGWKPDGEDTRPIIEKWYRKLGFDSKYDEEFYKALDEVVIPDYLTAEHYDIKCTDGRRNLLAFLYFCEELSKKYEKLGIPEEYLLDTLYDLKIYTNIYTEINGNLFLGELGWLKLHATGRIFKVGRLQFNFDKSIHDLPGTDIKKGDPVLGVHIPERGPLGTSDCEKSFKDAKAFFAKYFPGYNYSAFTCHSWLLGKMPFEILGENSNIVRFAAMFNVYDYKPSDAAIRYVFKWNTNRETVKDAAAKSRFAEMVKARVLSGGLLDSGSGFIRKDDVK